MSKFPLDLSKFKKVHQDESVSTLQHKDGHQLKIAHKNLSPELKGRLDKLPLVQMKAKKFADGGEAGANSESAEDSPDQIVSDAAQPQSLPSEEPSLPERAGKMVRNSVGDVEGGIGKAYTDIAAPVGSVIGGFGRGLLGVPPASANPVPGDGMPSESMPDQTPQAQAPAENPDPYGLQGSFGQQMRGIQEVGAGQQAEAQAIGNQGAANIQQEQNYQQAQQQAIQRYQEAVAPVMEERKALMADIASGHIDPQRYVNNMSTGDKIATGIGLVLGGIGSGLTHGPNLAYNYLDNQINRDIDSQKMDLGKKENLLSNNFRQSGDLQSALTMTKIQNNDLLSSHLRMTADQTADPMAKARIQQIQGIVDGQTAQLTQQYGMRRMQMGMFNGQPGSGNGAALELAPADTRERAVQLPNGGFRLAYTKDGAKEVRDQLQSIQPIFDSMDQLKALGPSALIPGTPANQKAQAIQAQLIPLVNENAGLKRLSAEDIGNIRKMISDPTTLSGFVSGARTQSMKQFLQDKMMSTMGNQLEGGMARQQQPQQAAPQPMSKSGKPIMQDPRTGKWHYR